jgi:alpha-2-macroglobulin
MRTLSRLLIALMIAALPFASACQKRHPKAGDSAISYIAAYTRGEISREQQVRVVFRNDFADSSKIGTPLKRSPISFSPSISGVVVWTDARTLEFRPAHRLEGGITHKVTLSLSEIVPGLKSDMVFKWQIIAMKQQVSVSLNGLQSKSATDIRWQQLAGAVITADVEYNAEVEKTVFARQDRRTLPVTWTHEGDRKTHSFIIDSIRRDDDSSSLTVQWDGAPIKAQGSGSSSITIPSLSSFSVTGVRAIPEPQSIEIRFSDPLLPSQRLDGLISLSNEVSVSIDSKGSIVTLSPSTPITGSVTLTINKGIKNCNGRPLRANTTHDLFFDEIKPKARFCGTGCIVPTTQGVTVPIEAVNLKSVHVQAFEVFEKNMAQFLQVNDLEGSGELHRVGRMVWEKTVALPSGELRRNSWVRYGLDCTEMVSTFPSGLLRLTLSFTRSDALYSCTDTAADTAQAQPGQAPAAGEEGGETQEFSGWNYADENLNPEGESESWQDRENPCENSYYRNMAVSRNVLVSNIGLTAKRGADSTLIVFATDLQTAQPRSGVDLKILNFQHETIGSGQTDGQGNARIACSGIPFLVIASLNKQAGYLKVGDGVSLSFAHFDVSGMQTAAGIKGYLYGERGVWRPGDSIYLTFVLHDPLKKIPDNHPVKFSLQNPRGQTVKNLTAAQGVLGFYRFATATEPSDPTGNYTATVTLGNLKVEKTLKVETVMPNRLKILITTGTQKITSSDKSIKAKIESRWLHGAIAGGLDYKIDLTLSPLPTRFPGFDDFIFDDPIRTFATETREAAAGSLDENGAAAVSIPIEANGRAPGLLNAELRTRVFEEAGAFSTDHFSIPYYPYKTFIGISVPKGDKTRGMLLTDTNHTVRIVALDANGKKSSLKRVVVKVFKINWRWWWEKGQESLAEYESNSSYSPLATDTVALANGSGSYALRINYPDWGRYLIRVNDPESEGHATGVIKYIDWPGWAGRQQKDNVGGGATVLTFTSDKDEYRTGEKITLTIPASAEARGLVSIESGSRMLQSEWVQGQGDQIRYAFDALPSMAPNIYAFVSLLQPHLQTKNDLPIRLYGVLPIKVVDPQTRLDFDIGAGEVLVPGGTATVTVSEKNQRKAAYTLAIVDEGLLDLTRFATPNPWDEMYQKEALGVRTWDLFGMVSGAYGGTLEKMLAIGGDEEIQPKAKSKANRFPPMVRFIGPCELKSGQRAEHSIALPEYVGSVRIMVVGGAEGAYGNAQRTAFVRRPLMILGTLPRVLGVKEEAALPVSVFALENKVKKVTVSVAINGPLSLDGEASRQIAFTDPGDQIVLFNVKAGASSGTARVVLTAKGAGEEAVQTIDIEVRSPMQRTTTVTAVTLQPGKSETAKLSMPGVPGSNKVVVEASCMAPINLGKRLDFLIQYPHGCIEQTTSSVFPQLYLDKLVQLSVAEKAGVEKNIKAGINRLRMFQTSDGGFSYWPGCGTSDEWGSNYAGHFLAEAAKAGYAVPAGLMDQWKKYERTRALSFSSASDDAALTQCYRLYLLALAGSPEMAAMNRQKEATANNNAARWQLAAAFGLAGQPEAGEQIVKNTPFDVIRYLTPGPTFGSDLRDKALILEAATLLKMTGKAKRLTDEIAQKLGSGEWESTQTTAFCLIALARHGGMSADKSMSYTVGWKKEKPQSVSTTLPICQSTFYPENDREPAITLRNGSDGPLWFRIMSSGIPDIGAEKAEDNALTLSVAYSDLSGEDLDPDALTQGSDLLAQVTVRNANPATTIENIALSHLFPSGWEIHNERMSAAAETNESPYDYRDIRDDRVYTYFSLKGNEEKTFKILLNASYIGSWYLPPVRAEAMYDASVNAQAPGRWIKVVSPGD